MQRREANNRRRSLSAWPSGGHLFRVYISLNLRLQQNLSARLSAFLSRPLAAICKARARLQFHFPLALRHYAADHLLGPRPDWRSAG